MTYFISLESCEMGRILHWNRDYNVLVTSRFNNFLVYNTFLWN